MCWCISASRNMLTSSTTWDLTKRSVSQTASSSTAKWCDRQSAKWSTSTIYSAHAVCSIFRHTAWSAFCRLLSVVVIACTVLLAVFCREVAPFLHRCWRMSLPHIQTECRKWHNWFSLLCPVYLVVLVLWVVLSSVRFLYSVFCWPKIYYYTYNGSNSTRAAAWLLPLSVRPHGRVFRILTIVRTSPQRHLLESSRVLAHWARHFKYVTLVLCINFRQC